MQMPEGESHPSTLPGFRGRGDPERSITCSRSGRKKKRVEFEDVQPQDIPNPTEDNFLRRRITQLPDGFSHIYYTGKELTISFSVIGKLFFLYIKCLTKCLNEQNQDSMRIHGTFTSVFKVWKDIATLPAVRDAVVNIFGQFMDIRLGNSDNRLIQALTERWWSTTHTFLFPCVEIEVTPLNFTMMTSLSIGRYPTQVPYDGVWSILSSARQLLLNIDSNHIKSGNVSIAHLKTYLTVKIYREDDITIARAFILFMMGHLWFQMANDTVPLGYLAAVNDLDLAAQYDWGSAILASLYHGLDTAVTTGGTITGFVQLLPYWFYEYCGVGHPIVKEEVKYLAYPRLRAWEKGNMRKTNDQAANLFIIGRYHIDHRTVETIIWEPWFDSPVSEIEDVLNAKLLSRKRIPLQVPNGNCEYYLGDKCWRQVTGEVRIPLDPPLSMSPHISLATLHEMRQAGFVDYEQFVVGEVRETYASYWAEQILEVGHMLTDYQRMGNLDLFRPSALRAGIIPVVITSASVHSLSQDFSLPGEAEGLDLGWHMQWTGRRENLTIAHLRDPPPMSSFNGTEELWHLTHGIRRLILAESARDAQRIQEVEEDLAIARRQLDSIDHQLYAHDLQLRRVCDVWVVSLPPGGDARTRQRGSVPRTRGDSSNRRGRGTGDDSE
ncbi:hypothetical protein GIB67_001998 [Kingdonia uniflora]|uniref:Aminotransferase-like plant mobile domain-containing protein n=1 Tax=Kingdonia uniflora TaxID=39325 RepID=A0A7J7M9Z8_9MAGN|nr:hypothetical protein GIB67_001998 [Kingdonia uniflora]